MPRLPAVQLIGAQKAGTSAIADWLFEESYARPNVFADEPWYYSKEVHFFDIDYRYNQGEEFYAHRFESGRPSLDATPETLQFADRVKATYDAVGESCKILLILRDPIERELSLYNHLAHDCRCLAETELTAWHRQVLLDASDITSIMTFDEFVTHQTIPALQQTECNSMGRSTRHSMYAHHLQSWFRCFDRKSQILLLHYDELRENPQRVQQRIQSFLQLQIYGELRVSNANVSALKVRTISRNTAKRLEGVFGPLNESLYKLLEASEGPPMEQSPFPRFHLC